MVRRYRALVEELFESFESDIRSGRKRAALVHFRALADYCLNCLFVAYPASEDELDRRSVPKNAFRSARRIIEHWNIPVGNEGLKKLEDTYHELSQAAHGAGCAVESFERMRSDLVPSTEKLARMMLEWVGESDLRLNSHRV